MMGIFTIFRKTKVGPSSPPTESNRYNDDCELMKEPEFEMMCPYYGIDCVPDWRECKRLHEYNGMQKALSALFALKERIEETGTALVVYRPSEL